MASNFEFLAQPWPHLAMLGKFAENNLYLDPNTTLSKLRLFAEKVALYILAYENLHEPEHATQYDRLKLLQEHGVLPYNIKDIFHQLKTYGNRAIHEGLDAPADAQTCLSFAHKLAVWFAAVYADNPEIVKQPFVLPVKQDLSAELERLRAEHEQTVHLLDQLQAQHLSAEKQQARKVFALQAARDLPFDEAETRKLIDAQLQNAGWEADTPRLKWPDAQPETGKNRAIAEWPAGPKRADYALFIGLQLVGIIEAKRYAKDVPSDLGQSKRYAQLVEIQDKEQFVGGPWNDYRVPFLFSANGRDYNELVKTKSGLWFLDGRATTNHPKPLRNWFSPQDLLDLLKQDRASADQTLHDEPLAYLQSQNGLGLRDYQIDAIKAVEQALAQGRDKVLLAMATGTGKTRTAIGLIYRLIKSKRFKRILFLVDRRSLGKQAQGMFQDAKIEDLQAFTDIYDLKGLQDKTPEDETKVQIATVQSLVRRIWYANPDRQETMPTVGQYDCIIVDEAHRGYLLDREGSGGSEDDGGFQNQKDYLSAYRKAIEYFEAVRIGLTATPALHTTEIFGPPVYTYSYPQAVIDGYLVDHEPPYQITTALKLTGIAFDKGNPVQIYNRKTLQVEEIAYLEDEVNIDIDGFNTQVITEAFNRALAGELIKYIDPLDTGKTLIFAASDEHADLVVTVLQDAYCQAGRDADDNAILKITGSVHDQDESITRFKNERYPNIVVTVDLLTTGIDVPAIVNLVFLRRVKSRILYEQMLGRATRLCEAIGKDHFTIYDAVGLYETLQPYTAMKPVAANASEGFVDLIKQMRQSANPAYWQQSFQHILAKLQRKKRQIARADKSLQEKFFLKTNGQTPEEYIHLLQTLPPARILARLQADVALFEWLDHEIFQPNFQYISKHPDQVVSVERGYGKDIAKPEDYLQSFKTYLDEHKDTIAALTILCQRPATLTRKDLKELKLILEDAGFKESHLNTAWNAVTSDQILVDLITFIRHLALGEPLVSHAERIGHAMTKIRKQQPWTKVQQQWLDRIEQQLLKDDLLTITDFDAEPFQSQGGFKRINSIFDGKLADVLNNLNDYLYETA